MSCDLDPGEGCLYLGDRYRDGLGVDADDFLASQYWGKGCEAGVEEACRRLNPGTG